MVACNAMHAFSVWLVSDLLRTQATRLTQELGEPIKLIPNVHNDSEFSVTFWLACVLLLSYEPTLFSIRPQFVHSSGNGGRRLIILLFTDFCNRKGLHTHCFRQSRFPLRHGDREHMGPPHTVHPRDPKPAIFCSDANELERNNRRKCTDPVFQSKLTTHPDREHKHCHPIIKCQERISPASHVSAAHSCRVRACIHSCR